MTEHGPDERFKTGFRHADGRVAEVFSSFRKPTVLRHFQWMRDYAIDGAFVQRFICDMVEPEPFRHHTTVLAHAREGANRHGRTYALMYDLTGLPRGDSPLLLEDLRRLRKDMRLTEDPAYLRHDGRPVLAIWGVGFRGDHRLTVAECGQLLNAVRRAFGDEGVTLMLGTPTHWRTLRNDAWPDAELYDVLRQADIISPWTVGRFRTPDQARGYARDIVTPDIAWCAAHGLEYLPVAFPGFSWVNLYGDAHKPIPRLGGEFLWSQAQAYKQAGAEMAYVAMFDEVDEATAVFKCTNDPPQSAESRFLTYEGLPTDHYLKLTGRMGALYRGELPATASLAEALASEPAPISSPVGQ